ncbi:uncharacterized protein LACBIDRAFT_313406 [Laccaria bicolor S238N-H82]|uniref:Predicted protein n=1 Tax=Laccaria bicolor (strain S238N-H82 / ATCC MYA-4686) TaxID=486041 RepID=B0DY88_LACBS|nr:uncharacterized protein LACBIDRAFT_313406 [Laccaria bicolor S238N-H82]EDR00514.1 predicted protein [Laccaria bicolor S238N-H82]|eukprot:XP_001888906.1 predicted protein [Laccaria bicolor S238N-H82]
MDVSLSYTLIHACTSPVFPLAPHIYHYVISSPLFSFFSLYRNIAIPRVEIRRSLARATPDFLTLASFSSRSDSYHLCITQKPRCHWSSLNKVFTQVQ